MGEAGGQAEQFLGKFIKPFQVLSGFSQFFEGEDKYFFPKTCNVWTAQAINKAGFDISPFRFQTAEDLIGHIRNMGKNIPSLKK